MSATPFIFAISCISSREIRSSSSISAPRTLIWIGFCPKAPPPQSPFCLPPTPPRKGLAGARPQIAEGPALGHRPRGGPRRADRGVGVLAVGQRLEPPHH